MRKKTKDFPPTWYTGLPEGPRCTVTCGTAYCGLTGLWVLCVAAWLGHAAWLYASSDDDASCPVYVEDGESDPHDGRTGEVRWQPLPPGLIRTYDGVFGGTEGQVAAAPRRLLPDTWRCRRFRGNISAHPASAVSTAAVRRPFGDRSGA